MKKQRFIPLRRRTQRGMAMVEALMAVLILAIGIIGTLGLQVHSQKALAEAGMRSEATIAASELIGVMNTDLDHLADYKLADNGTPGTRLAAWHKALVEQLPGAKAKVEVTPNDEAGRTAVAITIQWRRDTRSDLNTHRIVTYLSRSA